MSNFAPVTFQKYAAICDIKIFFEKKKTKNVDILQMYIIITNNNYDKAIIQVFF